MVLSVYLDLDAAQCELDRQSGRTGPGAGDNHEPGERDFTHATGRPGPGTGGAKRRSFPRLLGAESGRVRLAEALARPGEQPVEEELQLDPGPPLAEGIVHESEAMSLAGGER